MNIIGEDNSTLYVHVSLQEWDSQLKYLLLDLSDKSEDRNDDMTKIAMEKITALYGANAFKKTLEELKKDAKSTKIDELLLMKKKEMSNADVSSRKQKVFYIQYLNAINIF